MSWAAWLGRAIVLRVARVPFGAKVITQNQRIRLSEAISQTQDLSYEQAGEPGRPATFSPTRWTMSP